MNNGEGSYKKGGGILKSNCTPSNGGGGAEKDLAVLKGRGGGKAYTNV